MNGHPRITETENNEYEVLLWELADDNTGIHKPVLCRSRDKSGVELLLKYKNYDKNAD